MPTLESLFRFNDSAYVNAAKTESRNFDVINEFLGNPDNSNNNSEHNKALNEAIASNDFEIVKAIIDKANDRATGTTINPYKIHGKSFKETMSKIIENCFRYEDPAILKLLLQQKPIQTYLRDASHTSLTFKILAMMIDHNKNLNGAAEALYIAGSENPKRTPKISKNMYTSRFFKEQKTMLHGYQKITEHLNQGFKRDAKPTLRALPLEIIHMIYEFAFSDDVLQELPICKEQILDTTRSKVKKITNR